MKKTIAAIIFAVILVPAVTLAVQVAQDDVRFPNGTSLFFGNTDQVGLRYTPTKLVMKNFSQGAWFEAQIQAIFKNLVAFDAVATFNAGATMNSPIFQNEELVRDGHVLVRQNLGTTLVANNPNISVASNLSDSSGMIRVTANQDVPAGNIVTVTFADQYPGAVRVFYSPVGQLSERSALYSAQRGPASFTVAIDKGLTAGDEIEFDYLVQGLH